MDIDTTHMFGHKIHDQRQIHDGVQYLFKFPNNFGASVVKHMWSYGSGHGLWELAVVSYYEEDGTEYFELQYDTHITNDVIGSLSNEEVEIYLNQIMVLAPDVPMLTNDNHTQLIGRPSEQ